MIPSKIVSSVVAPITTKLPDNLLFIPDGTTFYWDMSGSGDTLYDLSGNGNAGVLKGTAVGTGKNLLTKNQSDIETDLTGIVSSGAVCTKVEIPTPIGVGTPDIGGNSCLQSVTTAGAYGFVYETSSSSIPKIPIVAGSAYTFSAYLKGQTGGESLVMRIQWYKDSSNLSVVRNNDAVVLGNLTTSWARYQLLNVVAPSDATYAVVNIYKNNNTALWTVFVDCIQFEQSTTVTSWVAGSSTWGGKEGLVADSVAGQVVSINNNGFMPSGIGKTGYIQETKKSFVGNDTQFTFMGWFKMSAQAPTGSPTYDNTTIFATAPVSEAISASSIEIRYGDNVGFRSVQSGVGTATTSYDITALTNAPTDWVFIVVAWDLDRAPCPRVYINGVLNASANPDDKSFTALGATPQYITVGGIGASGAYFFRGKIGLATLSKKWLSTSDIQRVYNETRRRFGV